MVPFVAKSKYSVKYQTRLREVLKWSSVTVEVHLQVINTALYPLWFTNILASRYRAKASSYRAKASRYREKAI